jgi:hypothetical protein
VSFSVSSTSLLHDPPGAPADGRSSIVESKDKVIGGKHYEGLIVYKGTWNGTGLVRTSDENIVEVYVRRLAEAGAGVDIYLDTQVATELVIISDQCQELVDVDRKRALQLPALFSAGHYHLLIP